MLLSAPVGTPDASGKGRGYVTPHQVDGDRHPPAGSSSGSLPAPAQLKRGRESARSGGQVVQHRAGRSGRGALQLRRPQVRSTSRGAEAQPFRCMLFSAPSRSGARTLAQSRRPFRRLRRRCGGLHDDRRGRSRTYRSLLRCSSLCRAIAGFAHDRRDPPGPLSNGVLAKRSGRGSRAPASCPQRLRRLSSPALAASPRGPRKAAFAVLRCAAALRVRTGRRLA